MRWMVKKATHRWGLLSYGDLMQAVCAEFEVSEEQLKGTDRSQQLVNARMAFVVVARFKFKNTTASIGERINRNHSSVLNLINRMADKEFLKDPVVDKVKRVEQLLTQTI